MRAVNTANDSFEIAECDRPWPMMERLIRNERSKLVEIASVPNA